MRTRNVTTPWTASPQTEPLTLTEAKAYLKRDDSVDDTLIAAQIAEARSWAEDFTHRALITRTVEGRLDVWPDEIWLPFGLTQSVAYIQYIDGSGATQTLYGASSSPQGTGFLEDLTSAEGGILVPPYGNSWPSARDQLGAITVRWSAGYGAASAIPSAIITAIKYRLAALYEVRGPQDAKVATLEAENLLQPYVIRRMS